LQSGTELAYIISGSLKIKPTKSEVIMEIANDPYSYRKCKECGGFNGLISDEDKQGIWFECLDCHAKYKLGECLITDLLRGFENDRI
jgi:hypothetical protein